MQGIRSEPITLPVFRIANRYPQSHCLSQVKPMAYGEPFELGDPLEYFGQMTYRLRHACCKRTIFPLPREGPLDLTHELPHHNRSPILCRSSVVGLLLSTKNGGYFADLACLNAC